MIITVHVYGLHKFNSLFKGQNQWTKYLSLTTEQKVISAMELDDHLLSIHASEELSFKNKQKDNHTWIITTTSKEQSEKYLKIKEINGTKVTVTAHAEMNSVWGTMLLFRDDGDDEARCIRIIERRQKNVEEVRFITLPRNNTKIAKIKFKGSTLPDKIYMGGRKRDVKPYIPKPSQCHKCSKYGHYKEYCNNEHPACFYCGSQDHASKWQCGNSAKCINCSGDHHARSQSCPFYVYNTQLRHLQIRTGMSVRDAREELRERGIQDPFKRTTYATAAKGTNASQRDPTRESDEGEPEATQMFQPEAREEVSNGIKTVNRFQGLEEESLDDESQEEEENNISMSELEDAWEQAKKAKPQRKIRSKNHTQSTQQKPAEKRTREDSPRAGDNAKENKNKSPPTKKFTGIGYSSSSEEETRKEANKDKEEKKGMPIPTIVNPRDTRKTGTIPNPFRGDTLTAWDEHPLQQTPPEQTRNDLEGVREEINKMFGTRTNDSNESKHPETCGCDTCFWNEKEKKGKLTETKVKELINEFTRNRKINQAHKEKEHIKLCMCVKCIEGKIKESKERVIKEIMEKTERSENRDPRKNKERKESQ